MEGLAAGVGPGLPVAYFEEEEDSGEELLTRLASELDAVDFDGRVVLEMGRFIAASCGSYVTSVADLKISEGQGYCTRGRRNPSRELLRSDDGDEEAADPVSETDGGGDSDLR